MDFSKGHVCRDPQQIAAGWGNSFKIFMRTLREIIMMQNFQKQVDSQVEDIMAELSLCSDRDPGHFSILEIRKAVRLPKTKKACGNDNVYNEHLIHGGNELYHQISLLNQTQSP